MRRLTLIVLMIALAGSVFGAAYNYPVRIPTGAYGYSSVAITVLQGNRDSIGTTTVSSFPYAGNIAIEDTCSNVLRFKWIVTGDTVYEYVNVPRSLERANITRVDGVALDAHDAGNLPADVNEWANTAVQLSNSLPSVSTTSMTAAMREYIFGAVIDTYTVTTSAGYLLRTRLAPTTVGRTLDVTTTGEAGLDFDNTVGTLTSTDITSLPTVTLAAGQFTKVGDTVKGRFVNASDTANKIRIDANGYVTFANTTIGTATNVTNAILAAGQFTKVGDTVKGRIVNVSDTAYKVRINSSGYVTYANAAPPSALDFWNVAYATAFTAGSMGDSANNNGFYGPSGAGLSWANDSLELVNASIIAIDRQTVSVDSARKNFWRTSFDAAPPAGSYIDTIFAAIAGGGGGGLSWPTDSANLVLAARIGVWFAPTITYGTDYAQMGGALFSGCDTATQASLADMGLYLWETYGTRGLTEGVTVTTNNDKTDYNVASLDLNAIADTNIQANAIGASEIAADAIGSSEIATDAIGTAELAAGAITSSEIATNAIGATQIATDAIGALEIAADAIGASELAAGAITVSEAPNLDAAISTRSTLTASDNIGINWADVANPTTTLDLSGTTVNTVTNFSGSVAISTSDKNTFVDLFWDEAQSGHTTSGTFGSFLDSKVSLAGGAGGWSSAEKDSMLFGRLRNTGDSINWLGQNIGVNFSDISGTLDAAEIGTDAITANKIAADAIGASEIATDAIGAAEIATNAITSSEAANLDAAVSSRAATSALPTYFSQLAIQNGTGYVWSANSGGTATVPDSLLAIVPKMNLVYTETFEDTSSLRVSGGTATVPDSLLEVIAVINANLDRAVSSVSGMAGNGAYTRYVILVDTGATVDSVLRGQVITINNLSQNSTPLQAITDNTGKGTFQLDAGTWVVFTTTPGFAASLDTVTITGTGIDTLKVYRSAGDRTTVAWNITKPSGYGWGYPQVTIELVSVHDSMLYVGDSIVVSNAGKFTATGSYTGLTSVDLYANSLFARDTVAHTGDSTYYNVTIRDSKKNLLIGSYKMIVPDVDTTVWANKLTRWN